VTFAAKGPPPGQEDGPIELSCLEGIDCSENRPPRPNTQAEFDAEIALALTASGWRAAAALLTHAAKCIDAGDFQSAERTRRQAREQFIEGNDIFRRFQETRTAEGGSLLAEAFL
jgi:hypothetical protein